MAQDSFEDLVDTFAFLDDWEDRYRHVIDMGKALPAMDAALKVPATKVDGCASQVWLHITPKGDTLHFIGDSDAMIVKGLIAVLMTLYNGLPLSTARTVDATGRTCAAWPERPPVITTLQRPARHGAAVARRGGLKPFPPSAYRLGTMRLSHIAPLHLSINTHGGLGAVAPNSGLKGQLYKFRLI